MITFQFCAMSALSSDVIKIFERGWCSHCDAVMPDGSLLGARSDVVGGKPAGVQIRPPSYEVWTRIERVSLEATPEQEAAFYAFLREQIGKPYDSIAIAAFAIGRDWRSPNSWFCSELQAAALEASKWFPKPLSSVANEITPRDLLLVVSPWAV